MSHHRLAVVAALSSLLLCIATVCRAEEPNKAAAKRHFEVGTRLYEVENYEGAVTEFETSVRLYRTKNGYFNLANCYKALHRYREALLAIGALETYFGQTLDSTMRQKTNALKTLIESLVGEMTLVVRPEQAVVLLDGVRLTRRMLSAPIKLGPGEHRVTAHLDGYASLTKTVTIYSGEARSLTLTLAPASGTLFVETNVDGAAVVVDGRHLGETPLPPVELRAGEHSLEISREGYAGEVRTVKLLPNSRTTIEVRLEKHDAAKPAAPAQSDRVENKLRAAKIASGVGTAAVAAVCGVFYGLAAKQASDFETYNTAYLEAPTDAAAAPFDSKRRKARDRNGRFATMGLSFGVAAGVLAVSTGLLILLSKPSKEKKPVSITGAGLTVSF